jgi:uncharacterized protein
VLWVLASLVLAALISPWIYQAGKALGARTLVEDLPGVLAWLGAAALRSGFSRFFDRSLLLSALLLLPLLLWRVRLLRRRHGVPAELPLARTPWSRRWRYFFTGLVIAAGLLWALGMSLEWAGAFESRDRLISWGKFLRKAVLPAVGASLLEEWLFRGLLLGLWLRFAKPLAACIGTSLLFAFVHFLKPADGTELADPAAFDAGFRLLGRILLNFTDPRFFAGDFATLFVVGMILALARVRTGGLAFSIGLHAGWILAFKGFNLLYDSSLSSALRPWGVGDSLRSGLLPLLTLLLTGLVCHLALRRMHGGPCGAVTG